MSNEKIIVIEDEIDIREVIVHNLKREGYQVDSCADGAAGLQMIRSKSPDLVLLDLMLPEIDGLEICRKLKSDRLTDSIPIIMVTAKGEESDIILGLGVGADDYVCKPFRPRELLARVKAVLRRGLVRDDNDASGRIIRGSLIIDHSRHEVIVDGVPVIFTATEFKLLHLLATYPGRVFTRDNIMNRIIGEDTFVVERNIDVHIRSIRKKLDKHRDMIETIRGVGYRFRDTID